MAAMTVGAVTALAATYAPQGGEFLISGSLPGDQMLPSLAISTNGGYLVWHDNSIDGNGFGVGARLLNQNFSPLLSPIRINGDAVGDQENAKSALQPDGSAVVVWQGGKYGFQHIFARFLKPDGTYATGDIRLGTYNKGTQVFPSVSVLKDGSVVVVWASFGQDGSMFGVYGQRLSSAGALIGTEFQVNSTTDNNQRTPSVAALSNGGFVVAWVNERLAGSRPNVDENGRNTYGSAGVIPDYRVQVYGRLYNASGVSVGDEFVMSSDSQISANPVVQGLSGGKFTVAWSGRPAVITQGVGDPGNWDIYARTFANSGAPAGEAYLVNTFTAGKQYRPQTAAIGDDILCVWTSYGQDGSREGVYARYLAGASGPVSDEFRVNTTTNLAQITPSVASDGKSRFVVAWGSFIGGLNSFDLFAQRYSAASLLPIPSAPFVSAISQSKLSVTWPELSGYPVAGYLLSIDGATAVQTTNIFYTVGGLNAGTTHSVTLAYKLASGDVSPASVAAAGTTWGEDANFDGLPDDWQRKMFGDDITKWGAANADSDGDGATNLQEFLAGTNPADKASVLRIKMTGGRPPKLSWNTQPGLVYQVQHTVDFTTWTNFGGPRFAPGESDSLTLAGEGKLGAYRVIRVR